MRPCIGPLCEIETAREHYAPSHSDQGIIGGLSPAIIPQREFPLRKWYYANPLWYYHAPALEHRLQSDPKFYELVDPELRELCRLVLESGLCTTPSCQGHSYPRERFEQIWEELGREATLIRGAGLEVTDSETDGRWLFKDADYELPWRDAAAFIAQAGSHQNQGYIGVAVPADREEIADRLQQRAFQSDVAQIALDRELSAVIGQALFGVSVNARTTEECTSTWRAVTAYFRETLSSPDVPAHHFDVSAVGFH